MTLNMSHSQQLKNIMDKKITDQFISWSVIFTGSCVHAVFSGTISINYNKKRGAFYRPSKGWVGRED